MDVLLGSIDVRELLSTLDLDDSSPLSAPDLRLLIDRLQIRSLRIKDKVRSYVLAHRQDFADIFDRCSLAADGADDLARSLDAALRLLSDDQEHRPLDCNIKNLLDEIRGKRRELRDRREALEVVRGISVLHERIKSAREDLRAGRFVEAAIAARDLKSDLPESQERRGESEPVVFGLLRKELADCLDELQEVLAKNVEDFVQFEPENGRVIIKSSINAGEVGPMELRVVIKAMEIIGILDYGLARVADSMVKHTIIPAISNTSVDILFEVKQGPSREPDSILNIISSSDIKEDLDGRSLYAKLSQIVRFIYKFIFFEDGTWMLSFGRLIWPRMSDLIIVHFLSKAVPADASKITDFENIMQCSAEFENFLKEVMFISSADPNEEKLSHFGHNVEVHFASRKKNEILAKARHYLLTCNYDPSAASSNLESFSNYTADLIFQPDRCTISKAASHLMDLAHEALKDACLSSARVAKEFYHAARDALLLYKASIPIKLEKQLNNLSQVALIVHNDCCFLSHEVLGLAFEYRADLPSNLQKHAVFIDIALSYHQMAEEVLREQVQLIFASLMEAIDNANGFQNTHQLPQFKSAELSIEQVVLILEKIRIMWEPLMPAQSYKRTMCTMLGSMFSRITRDMLLLDDMAAEETIKLQSLIQLALENLSSIFKSLITQSDEKEQFLNHITWSPLDEMIPPLRKFRKLADLYDMPLKSITTEWETGELQNCGFTLLEVENFVKAIFQDSPLRKECLLRIENSSYPSKGVSI